MAYELLNVAQVTPARLHALVRLISRLRKPQRKELLDLLQPSALISDQSSARAVYTAAVNCGIIKEGLDKTVMLTSEASALESVEGFRTFMQYQVLGKTESLLPNYLFNLYSAWYIVQNERIFQFRDKDYETYFLEVYNKYFLTEIPQDDDTDRAFNMLKFVGWLRWAVFLGLGWPMKSGSREILVPCASYRIRAILPLIFNRNEQQIRFGVFAEQLAIACPELDGGILFRRCWEASQGSELRGNQISLAVSTGLRQLEDAREVKLIREADAMDVWQLYPAEGQHLQQVTHIRLEGN